MANRPNTIIFIVTSNWAMSKSSEKSTAAFVEKARTKHGDKYDYSEVAYLAAKKKVRIFCAKHGVFLQTPSDHLSGCGCPSCGIANRVISNRNPIDKFIAQAEAVIGRRYDYSQVEYRGLRSKVKIICPEHGEFQMTPGTHLKNRHCPKCTGRAFVPTGEFIARAIKVHKGRYDYSLVNCQHNRELIKILCPEHGVFEQTPRSHLMGGGCEKCAHVTRGLKKRSNASTQFIVKAHQTHGEKYDYSRMQYKRSNANVTIGCNEHGYFQQTPANHLFGRGCPSCSSTGFDPTRPAKLYYLSVNSGQAFKIGITNRTLEERFSTEDRLKITVVSVWHFEIGQHARDREVEILKTYSNRRYKGPALLSNGNSELFESDVLGLYE